MNFVWLIVYVLLGYVAFVAVAEGLIRFVQPDMEGGVTLFVTDAQGHEIKRNLASLEHEGALYISSNHWLRSWYDAALKNPEVEIIRNGVRGPYTAVPIKGAERATVSELYRMGFVLRFICGFAPSKFLRLDPR